ncbi:MAG: aminotransferase class V-fold PLP-dependent enzyme [Alphaproteobacteria bacterium]|nr:aminotransferase class V-fold PLP-dependent enzyme [Alphaproteobacteria bacterium]
MSKVNWDFYDKNGFTRIINVNGTMTGLGASMAVQPAIQATAEIMPHFVNMHELQEKASSVISELTGAEAGFIAASASAGISMSIAACLTGDSVGKIEQLPKTIGQPIKVAVQMGHLCHYGASIEQAISLTGAQVTIVGQSTQVLDHQLEYAVSNEAIAAVYVVSHHVVEYGQIPLKRFCEICHAADVPVIVDAASEYDLEIFLADGADIVIYSGHKFLSGPTSGILAGKKDLIKAAYMQNLGIARGMKIGKESIYGAMAALKAWKKRDHAAIRQQEQSALKMWLKTCENINGITASMHADVTHNPLDRLKIQIDKTNLGASAGAIALALNSNNPKIIVRDHEVELGYIQLDPCNLAQGHAEIVSTALTSIFEQAILGNLPEPDFNKSRNSSINSYLNWISN